MRRQRVNGADISPGPSPAPANERRWVWLLCALAALRVLVFCAAFPFFNNVDEQAHFDLVMRYAHGEVPRGDYTFSPESANYIALYGSVEYLQSPKQFPGGQFPPPLWRWPREQARPVYLARLARWQSKTNHEASSPPLYYAPAGLWLRAGRVGGLDRLELLFWIRFLNGLLAAALVWLGYLAARMIFPEQRVLRLGVPLLLAFFPQDAFYSIQSDVLSPLGFGAAFLGLAQLLRAEVPSARVAAATGLCLAATGLIKSTNLILLAAAAAGVGWTMRQRFRTGRLRPALPALSLLAVGTVLPLGAWMLWSRHAFGDFTGAGAKIKLLGWTAKPIGQWWPHPIFTPAGLWTFCSDVLTSFWRGELAWHGRPLASPVADAGYAAVSLLFVGIAVAALFVQRRAPDSTGWQRSLLWFGFGSFALSILFLAVMSLRFDYGNCFYPSRDNPYITSGRLISGTLIPFALLFVYGLDRALKAARLSTDTARLAVLGGLIVLMTISEIALNLPAFASESNWFHL
jgi:hypothetical protein